MDRTHHLGELQYAIMRVLWDAGESSVAEVHRSVPSDKELAYTTIATMLRKMEARGLVSHRVDGRTFIYQPAVEENTVTRRMADDLVDRLFAGSLTEAVSHLLSNREVSRSELTKLEKLIRERKARS